MEKEQRAVRAKGEKRKDKVFPRGDEGEVETSSFTRCSYH